MKNNFLKKNETLISILLIIIYVVLNSFCIQNFGLISYKTTILNYLFLLIIIIFIVKNSLLEYYGLTKIPNFKKFLYFIPLVIIITTNFWNGINIYYSMQEIVIYILTMLCIGFLEELIFRGFLYKMMEFDNIDRAVIVSSLTFGIGHIINLLNGSDLILTLIQICYAVALGYLFVIIFQKCKSLWPCIITHGFLNSLSIFNIENFVSLYIAPICLIVISILYSIYLKKTCP